MPGTVGCQGQAVPPHYNTGTADGLAVTRRCRPCQGKLKSNVFASCHEYKQQQRFSVEFLPCDFSQLSSATLSLQRFSSWAFTEGVQAQQRLYPNLSWGPGKINLSPDMVAAQEAHRLFCSHKEKEMGEKQSC